jgi:hypothetical protein
MQQKQERRFEKGSRRAKDCGEEYYIQKKGSFQKPG